MINLTTRLTAFFLGALALVLVAFSGSLYIMARSGLSGQADERLNAALGTLTAAVEFDAGALEWEPNQRLVALGQEPEADEVRWTVHDGAGALVDRSLNLGSPRLLASLPMLDHPGTRRIQRVALAGRSWRVVQRRLDPASASGRPSTAADSPRYSALVITAVLCLESMEATLAHLGRLLVGLSLGVWLLAAALGAILCRRALRPLTRMAEAAQTMGAAEFDQRLPSPKTGDELQELADAFNGLLDRLHEAYERQARFTGDASHQLRTPLAAMIGQIEVSLRRERPADDYRRTLRLVRDQAAHLGRIVESLLFLARADADAELPDRQVVDLRDWTREHLTTWSSHPRAADIHRDRSEDDGRVLALVHPPLLGQLVDNLLDNACKYSANGTPIRIGVRCERGDDGMKAILSVMDQGEGITPEDLRHIFEPFFRSSRSRLERKPGVGLGLTVAQRIASAFDGSLEAKSPPGQGTLITLTLPNVAEAGDDAVLENVDASDRLGAGVTGRAE
jgi:signal transduction histidine kinase